MRRSAVILACDNCKTVVQVDDMKDIPLGWVRVQAGTDNGQPRDGFDLCTLSCAVEWAKARRRAIGDPGDYQCEVCQEFMGITGKGGHMKKHEAETAP